MNAVVTGLLPNTAYHFRAYSSNAGGLSTASDQAFTTAATVPTATTSAATAITKTTATLNGTVNPNGTTTAFTFEYGTTTAYGSTVTATPSSSSGNATVTVGADISGLTLNTVYHFRVVGTNASGKGPGADMTFLTLPDPPIATATPATNITTSEVTLHGTVNSNGVSATVIFEHGFSEAELGYYGNALQSPLNGTAAVSYNGIQIQPNTTVFFRVKATNTGGTSYSNVLSFTTLPVATAVTNAPTNVTTSSATLNGIVNPNGLSATVTFSYGLTTSYGTNATAVQSPLDANAGATPVSVAISDWRRIRCIISG